MKPEEKSKHLLKIVKSKAKMLEYDVPENFQNINYPASPNSLFPLAITLVADLCRKIRKNEPINDAVDILFSPQFFDSFVNAKFDDELSDYLNLIGSAAFYLADMPGSSSVLIKKVSDDFNLNIDGLEKILKWLLVGNINDNLSTNSVICSFVQYFFKTGDETLLLKECENLRKNAYDQNNATYLFYADIIDAVILKKINNSTWKLLPLYSNLSIEDWKKTLLLDNFIKELWPAQKIIGEKGCYKGESAVIQMPTSSGKTKSIEIILRSAFLSERDVNLAVIVAPFRALCHEINDSLKRAFCDDLADVSELSDVYQIDVSFDIFQKTNKPKILILTPEKLLYILHHDQSISDKIKLIIFDEAHQFDNGIRGITYELLLTSLKLSLSSNVQKILISAVVPNANNSDNWLDLDGLWSRSAFSRNAICRPDWADSILRLGSFASRHHHTHYSCSSHQTEFNIHLSFPLLANSANLSPHPHYIPINFMKRHGRTRKTPYWTASRTKSHGPDAQPPVRYTFTHCNASVLFHFLVLTCAVQK